MHFVFHKMMICVRNPTVHPNFDAYYDIAQTAEQKAQIRKYEKKRGVMKVPIIIQRLSHHQENDGSSNLISSNLDDIGRVHSTENYDLKTRTIIYGMTGIGALGIIGLLIIGSRSLNPHSQIRTISDSSTSSNILPSIVKQDIAVLRSPLASNTTIAPNVSNSSQTDYSDYGTGGISTDITSTNNNRAPSMSVSINGQAVPALQDNSSQHTSIITQPNGGNTVMQVTTTDNSNGSSNTFSSSNEDMSVNSLSTSYDREGQ
jgi:hypothetical protein